jgi:hypothetical protein
LNPLPTQTLSKVNEAAVATFETALEIATEKWKHYTLPEQPESLLGVLRSAPR